MKAPQFLLRDQHGRPTGPQQNAGHWTVVTFLYTHCPDVCPLVAQQLGAAQRANHDLRVIDPSGKERELFDAKVTARAVVNAVQALS